MSSYYSPVFEFTAANGVPFTAVYNDPHDHRDDEPLIGFYDRRYASSPYGQFTGASYYVSSLVEGRYHHIKSGLNLHGGVTDWTVDADSMIELYRWMEKQS